jgi:hypothetical protein
MLSHREAIKTDAHTWANNAMRYNAVYVATEMERKLEMSKAERKAWTGKAVMAQFSKGELGAYIDMLEMMVLENAGLLYTKNR